MVKNLKLNLLEEMELVKQFEDKVIGQYWISFIKDKNLLEQIKNDERFKELREYKRNVYPTEEYFREIFEKDLKIPQGIEGLEKEFIETDNVIVIEIPLDKSQKEIRKLFNGVYRSQSLEWKTFDIHLRVKDEYLEKDLYGKEYEELRKEFPTIYYRNKDNDKMIHLSIKHFIRESDKEKFEKLFKFFEEKDLKFSLDLRPLIALYKTLIGENITKLENKIKVIIPIFPEWIWERTHNETISLFEYRGKLIYTFLIIETEKFKIYELMKTG